MKALHIVACILVAVGGINWGLVGLDMLQGGNGMGWNVVHMIFGSSMDLESIVYVLVGASAVWLLVTHKKDCRNCRA